LGMVGWCVGWVWVACRVIGGDVWWGGRAAGCWRAFVVVSRCSVTGWEAWGVWGGRSAWLVLWRLGVVPEVGCLFVSVVWRCGCVGVGPAVGFLLGGAVGGDGLGLVEGVSGGAGCGRVGSGLWVLGGGSGRLMWRVADGLLARAPEVGIIGDGGWG